MRNIKDEILHMTKDEVYLKLQMKVIRGRTNGQKQRPSGNSVGFAVQMS